MTTYGGTTTLVDETRRLLTEAARRYPDGPVRRSLAAAAERLDEPLRVAIAGRVKAGKSTLLNALVGEPLAPTDARECTRVVTWYRNGISYGATIHLLDGGVASATIRRTDGSVEVDLGPVAVDDIQRLVVDWPAAPLRRVTLVDTPGIASVRQEISARTTRFLLPGEEDEPLMPADAVLYLLRHVHAADSSFLEAFTDQSMARATPANAIGVLSRADEVGGGRLDAMVGARRVADRYRNDPDLRRLCQTVVPVAGLTAQAAVTLKQFEFAQFRSLAVADRDALDDVLLSANRFLAADPTITGDLTPEVRRQLLDRFGLWGVRISVALVRAGVAPSAPRLADELVERSGLAELRRVLADQLGTRAEALKARTALILLRRTVIANPIDGGETIRAEVERTLASAHVLEELRLLPALRAGTSGLRGDLVPLAERLLGGGGSSMEVRLGLDQTTDAPAASSAAAVASAEVERWQSVAAHPLTSPAGRHAAQVLSRTAEGLALAVTAETGRSAHPNQQETTITQ
jgi:GTPase SAR1 family protein